MGDLKRLLFTVLSLVSFIIIVTFVSDPVKTTENFVNTYNKIKIELSKLK